MPLPADDDFDAARRHFLDGVVCFEAGDYGRALADFQASLRCLPGRPSTLVNIAATHLRLGDAQAALVPLQQALAQAPHDADAWAHQAHALDTLGRQQEALDSAERALAIEPGHAAAGYRRASSLLLLRRPAQALAALDAVLAHEPALAEAWMRRGQALQSLGRHDEALPAYRQAVQHDPALAPAWLLIGGLLNDMGQPDAAVDAFRRSLALGGDAEINGYFLAGLTGEPAPSQAPTRYVEQLFDGYAEDFDHHLVQVLRYRGPAVLVEGLKRLRPDGVRATAALDLGCGTGLCGPLLRPLARHLQGVDLSAAMLERAAATGAYDELLKAELAEHLQATPRRHDLVVAADVFIYVGALEAVFQGLRRVLQPGGLFAWSVEASLPGEPALALRPSLRYAHSQGYLEGLAAAHGLKPLCWQRAPLREDQRVPIGGLFAWFERSD